MLKKIFKGAYLNNQFELFNSGISWQRKDPMNESHILLDWYEEPEAVTKALEAAEKAFESWSQRPLEKRIELLKRFKSVFEQKASDFEEAIILETGKARWEARIEAQALIRKVDITIESMLPLLREIEKACFKENTQELSFRPRGVCAVLGPFNFPMHLANGHIVPALLAGNSVIFKPSEHASACASLYAQAIQEVGLPSGVFQMLPGGAETGRRLVEDPRVKGIFFTGSYAVGERITKSLHQSRKDLSTLCALEMGGKNAIIADSSANFDQVLGDSILSAYATAGQRCSCASRLFLPKTWLSDFQKAFIEKAKQISIGDPSDEKTFMGPLIHREAALSFETKLARAKEAGLQALLETENLKENSALMSPAVYLSEDPETQSQGFGLQEEFFGPQICLIPYETKEEVVRWHESCPYALVSSLYAKDRKMFDWYADRLELGLFNFNKATVGASSNLPFGGLKKSGNNWPTALFAYFYCSVPQGRLFGESGFEVSRLPQPLQAVWSES